MNSNLQKSYSIREIIFTGVKITKSLALISAGSTVYVKEFSSGKDVGQFAWSLSDIVTNIHSDGFINKKEAKYYEFKKIDNY
jgi:hypothetical protein